MHLKWRFERNTFTTLVVAALSLVLFNNCDGGFATQKLSDPNSSDSSGIVEQCGESKNAVPTTIDQAVELINGLPKPLSVACFLSHLQKPLQVYAVDNVFSAQPSQGPDNPRIFLLSNKQLAISVVPLGPGREVVEFSEITSTTTSVKGEIGFPILDKIESSAPYSRIIEGVGKTSCSVCHQPEMAAPQITTGEAYNSAIIQPDPLRRIRSNRLLYAAQKCDSNQDPERCDILRTIFINGNAQDADFPGTTPRN